MRRLSMVCSLMVLWVIGHHSPVPVTAMTGRMPAMPQMTLQPAAGVPFTTVTATVYLTSTLKYPVWFYYTSEITEIRLGSCRPDTHGKCVLVFKVPHQQPVGKYTVIAFWAPKVGPYDSAAFVQVWAILRMARHSGAPGIKDTVHGYGFDARDGVTVTYAKTVVCPPAACMTDATGSFTHTITIPTGYPAGTYQIWAVDSHGITATIAFKQTA